MLDMRWPTSRRNQSRYQIKAVQLSRCIIRSLPRRLTSLLATLTISPILIIHEDTPFLHQPDLFLIVSLEVDLSFRFGSGR